MDLEQLALDIQSAYVKKKQVTMPFYKPRAEDAVHFQKAAVLCHASGAEPVAWVHAISMNVEESKFYTTMLHCAQSTKYYDKYVNTTKQDLQDVFNMNMQYLKEQVVDGRRSVEDALLDDNVQFSPWFRVSVTKEPVPEVERKYRARAREYLYDDDLVKFLEAKKILHRVA